MGKKKKERQYANYLVMRNFNTQDGLKYADFVKDVYKRYKEELENRSIFTKIVVFLFGEINVLGENLVDTYGKENLDRLISDKE